MVITSAEEGCMFSLLLVWLAVCLFVCQKSYWNVVDRFSWNFMSRRGMAQGSEFGPGSFSPFFQHRERSFLTSSNITQKVVNLFPWIFLWDIGLGTWNNRLFLDWSPSGSGYRIDFSTFTALNRINSLNMINWNSCRWMSRDKLVMGRPRNKEQ